MRRKLAILAGIALLAGLLAPTAGAQVTATIVPLQVTGPPAERLNLIVFGDGYMASEMTTFYEDIDRNQNVQWATEPFKSYRNYFNVYAVETPSTVSGISCDPDDGNVRRDTPLGLQFAGTCPAPALARGITYSSAGNAARTTILNTVVGPYLGLPGNAQNIQTLALANTFTYGGIGGTHATTSGGSPQGPLISLHELGHSLGQMADEYPYSNREIPGGAFPNSEPGSFHHSRLTEAEMLATQSKWWRWLCEESLSGGIITARDSTCGDPHEGGQSRHLNVWRPSEHSIMRWIGFYWDQPGREHMTYRITGRRNANAMSVLSTPQGEVGPNDVVWVETGHPKYHELTVTWTVDGVAVPSANNSRNLDLGELGVSAGAVVTATVKDENDFVRDPAFLNGPRMTQTRTWTVGTPLPAATVPVEFTNSTPTTRAVGGEDVVFVETTHPTDRILNVTWELQEEGKPFSRRVLPNPSNSRNLDLEGLGLDPGTYLVFATVTDPADPGGASDTVEWTVDNTLPTAPAELSEPLVELGGFTGPVHNVYFSEFTMGLEPQDDQTGFVVGEFELDDDGWFNYFGFPEQPHGTPFKFSHSGSNVKALTYGNLGTGGLSKATFEQSFPDFVPGYGTHKVEHRAIDAAGNIGEAGEFRATVLPGEAPDCTTTLTGKQRELVVSSGVTCVVDGTLNGGVTVLPGATLVVSGGLIRDGVDATDATVHLFDVEVRGASRIDGNAVIAGSNLKGGLTLTGGDGGEWGIPLVGNVIKGLLACSGNTPGVDDYGVENDIDGIKTGDCADL
jgi:hypothetical protein